jgi:hypothetical protein
MHVCGTDASLGLTLARSKHPDTLVMVVAHHRLQPQFSAQSFSFTAFSFVSMVKLVDLPNELLLNVASWLMTTDPADIRSLYSLCRASRALLKILLPALYTCVRISETPSDPLKFMKCFLRTILQHPELAKETQTLALTNDRGIRYEWPFLQQDPFFMDLSFLIHGHAGEIEPELCYCPLAAEVLTRLPNLQHIHFTAEIEPPRALLERVHQLQSETSILSKLKTFHL